MKTAQGFLILLSLIAGLLNLALTILSIYLGLESFKADLIIQGCIFMAFGAVSGFSSGFSWSVFIEVIKR